MFEASIGYTNSDSPCWFSWRAHRPLLLSECSRKILTLLVPSWSLLMGSTASLGRLGAFPVRMVKKAFSFLVYLVKKSEIFHTIVIVAL